MDRRAYGMPCIVGVGRALQPLRHLASDAGDCKASLRAAHQLHTILHLTVITSWLQGHALRSWRFLQSAADEWVLPQALMVRNPQSSCWSCRGTGNPCRSS